MQTFTAAQRALLDARDDQVKMCIEIDDTTPIRYCTGADPIQISSDWYDPHPIMFDKIALTDPRTSRTVVHFDDSGGDIRAQWYTSKLDADATVYWYLRESDGSWTQVLTVAWSVEECSFNRSGMFSVSLSAASGSRPRSGGTIGTRSEFPYAPTAGEPLRLGQFQDTTGVTFRPGIGVPPPPPGGQQMAYKPGATSNPISDSGLDFIGENPSDVGDSGPPTAAATTGASS
jgi:hypothetical protein